MASRGREDARRSTRIRAESRWSQSQTRRTSRAIRDARSRRRRSARRIPCRIRFPPPLFPARCCAAEGTIRRPPRPSERMRTRLRRRRRVRKSGSRARGDRSSTSARDRGPCTIAPVATTIRGPKRSDRWPVTGPSKHQTSTVIENTAEVALRSRAELCRHRFEERAEAVGDAVHCAHRDECGRDHPPRARRIEQLERRERLARFRRAGCARVSDDGPHARARRAPLSVPCAWAASTTG